MICRGDNLKEALTNYLFHQKNLYYVDEITCELVPINAYDKEAEEWAKSPEAYVYFDATKVSPKHEPKMGGVDIGPIANSHGFIESDPLLEGEVCGGAGCKKREKQKPKHCIAEKNFFSLASRPRFSAFGSVAGKADAVSGPELVGS